MKSILTSLTAIAVYSRCCDFGYTVKGILVGVIAGALAGVMYEALKKAPPDKHREYGRRLPNGINAIIPQKPSLVKEGVINTDYRTRSLLYGHDAELPDYLSDEPRVAYVCSHCDGDIYEGERYIDEDLVLCEECAKNLTAEEVLAMMDIGYSIAERAEREYD